MNILVPSVGRKYLLAKMLREALERRGGRLLAADASPLASGLMAAHESIRLPLFDAPEYWPETNKLLADHKIDAVIPVRDAELAEWARFAQKGGITARVHVSAPKTLEICLDKWELRKVAMASGLLTPDTELLAPGGQLTESICCPVILKPRRGAGGRSNAVARSRRMVEAILAETDTELLVQQFIEGPEFSVDCYAAADGNLKAAIIRKRLSIVGGQSDIGETVYDEELASLCRRLAANLNFRGALNFQFIRGKRGPMLIDVNPRFAGAVAISKAAGADLADWTVADLYGEAAVFPASYNRITWLGYSDGVLLEKP